MPNWMKMIEAKTALAKRGAKPSRPGENPRIPPGQKQVHMNWKGGLAREVIMRARPQENARFVTLHSADEYTTNLPLEALLDDDVILAHSVFGKPLAPDHGGPVRLVVPKRYAWKSAKWLTGIEFHQEDRPGFWEVRGYHNDADPWKEQRFSAAEL